MHTPSDMRRFQASTDRNGPTPEHCSHIGQCWTFRGYSARGYVYIQFAGKKTSAHRIAWTLAFGPVPQGLHVCHRCDNRRCVRPDHLFLATGAENHEDKCRKGRQAKGERHGHATLSDQDVRDIRALRASGLTDAEIACRYATPLRTIWNITSFRRRVAC